MRTPRWLLLVLLVAVAASWIPLALIARDRTTRSASPRFSLVPDMDKQPKMTTQAPNPLFVDGRAARRPVPGTVARGQLHDDDHFYHGIVNGEWAKSWPVPVTDNLLKRGRERFDIFCSPCHGLDGSGNGIIGKRAEALEEGTWVPPSSLHTDLVRRRPVGHLFHTITNGIRNMPSYGHMIPEADRWAIIAYVRALQRSRNATLDDVPPEKRATLR